ncbi:MAG: peptide transporter ATP-binding protein [Microbacterium sp.]|jgi:oligopeptide/dipeptide ABC transporter ATP-binding protein|nr:peptide transporter ATP-binding protein [Microbacterium sp.]
MSAALSVRNIVKEYPVRTGPLRRRTGTVHAVSGVDFEVERGTTFGLVGESGCGKSTLARCIVGLIPTDDGSVAVDGEALRPSDAAARRRMRRDLQLVFQDPYASLNPRLSVRSILEEPLQIHGRHPGRRGERVAELLELVGLDPRHANRYPHEFSGGQRQRIGIARALAVEPRVIVLDEPVSALDVSVQAGVLNMLETLQEQLGLSYVFIAHDLSVVRHLSDRVAVMYLGRIVEEGPADVLYDTPAHPYTQALLSAVPVADPRVERTRERIVLTGDVPSPAAPPSGCRFRTRCWKATARCATEAPPLNPLGDGRSVACHYPEPKVVI